MMELFPFTKHFLDHFCFALMPGKIPPEVQFRCRSLWFFLGLCVCVCFWVCLGESGNNMSRSRHHHRYSHALTSSVLNIFSWTWLVRLVNRMNACKHDPGGNQFSARGTKGREGEKTWWFCGSTKTRATTTPTWMMMIMPMSQGTWWAIPIRPSGKLEANVFIDFWTFWKGKKFNIEISFYYTRTNLLWTLQGLMLHEPENINQN